MNVWNWIIWSEALTRAGPYVMIHPGSSSLERWSGVTREEVTLVSSRVPNHPFDRQTRWSLAGALTLRQRCYAGLRGTAIRLAGEVRVPTATWNDKDGSAVSVRWLNYLHNKTFRIIHASCLITIVINIFNYQLSSYQLSITTTTMTMMTTKTARMTITATTRGRPLRWQLRWWRRR